MEHTLHRICPLNHYSCRDKALEHCNVDRYSCHQYHIQNGAEEVRFSCHTSIRGKECSLCNPIFRNRLFLELINLEFLIFGRMGVIEDPLLKGNIIPVRKLKSQQICLCWY